MRAQDRHAADLPLFAPSSHTSYLGALDAKGRAQTQTRRYLLALRHRWPDGLTDLEAATLLKLQRSSINARRRPFCEGLEPWIQAKPGQWSYRRGPTGVRNQIWVLTTRGFAAVQAMEDERP